MFGSDFIHITDHRGFESGFWWSDILTVLGVYPGPDEGEDWVKIKFRSDRQPDLHIVMSMTEFLEQVEKQLGASILQTPSYITPGSVSVVPLSNQCPDEPTGHIETWMKHD